MRWPVLTGLMTCHTGEVAGLLKQREDNMTHEIELKAYIGRNDDKSMTSDDHDRVLDAFTDWLEDSGYHMLSVSKLVNVDEEEPSD